jgi:Kelch motif
MSCYGGKMYVFGGLCSITQETNDVWQFDPAGSKWTALFDCSLTPRAYYTYQLASMKKEGQKKCEPPIKESTVTEMPSKDGTKKEGEASRINLITPMTQRMINSPLIEHSDKSFDIYYQQLKKKKKAMQGMSPRQLDQNQLVRGYFPCVRSSHRMGIFNDYIIVMGGDKNQMALNDIFFFRLK